MKRCRKSPCTATSELSSFGSHNVGPPNTVSSLPSPAFGTLPGAVPSKSNEVSQSSSNCSCCRYCARRSLASANGCVYVSFNCESSYAFRASSSSSSSSQSPSKLGSAFYSSSISAGSFAVEESSSSADIFSLESSAMDSSLVSCGCVGVSGRPFEAARQLVCVLAA